VSAVRDLDVVARAKALPGFGVLRQGKGVVPHHPGIVPELVAEVERLREELAGEQRLTSRDPDLDLALLDRAHERLLRLWQAALRAERQDEADELEALLVASGYGWPPR